MFGIVALVFEVVVAALILSRGRAVRLGLFAAILFLIGIMPLGKEELPDPILAVGLAYLMTKDYTETVPSEIGSRLQRRTVQPFGGRLVP